MKQLMRRLAKLEASGIFLRRPKFFLGKFTLFEGDDELEDIPAEDEVASDIGPIEPDAPAVGDEVPRSHE